jgi:spore coat protein A
MFTRRKLLRAAGALAGSAVAVPLVGGIRRAYPFAQSPTNLRKFVIDLPGLGPAGANQIGQYLPLGKSVAEDFAGLQTDVYRLAVAPFSERMHPDLPRATNLYGYYDLATREQKYLGAVIVAKRGTPVLFHITNRLPNASLIPADPTLGASATKTVGELPLNRIVTHLHGGFTPWFSDGTPFQWFDPTGMTGASFKNVPGTRPPAGTATHWYPMDQSARMLWYHDHAMGTTRTNVYQGIVSAFIVTDDFEADLFDEGLLPDPIGTPLVIQDKTFVPEDILAQDPSWIWGKAGDLWYPHVYEPDETGGQGPSPSCSDNPKGRWEYGPCESPPAVLPASSSYFLPTPASVVAEAFFDTILINGGVYPVAHVPPKRVRVRILNGAQARFFHLSLYPESQSAQGEAQVGTPGPIAYQIGTEGGLLPRVAIHDNTTPLRKIDAETAIASGPFNLLLAPAERADLVIDFNGVAAGASFILYNDAVAPFPGGDSRNDYYTGDADQTAIGGAPSTKRGFGPNTRTLMRIVVGSGAGDRLPTDRWLAQLNEALAYNFATGNQPPLLYSNGNPSRPGPVPYTGPITRQLTLNEDFDDYGRLIQTIGTFSARKNNQGLETFGLPYLSRATETPHAGAVEVWQIYNLTGDTHPIHFHLVNVQIIQRQAFAGTPATGITLKGRPRPPDPNETGWKDTVRMNPGEATTVIMQFNLPALPQSMGNPLSARTGGHEYVWHCHILEHEEHDMMRPLVVQPAAKVAAAG